MTPYSRFSAFIENIKLTELQNTDAKTKYDNVCRSLHNHYYPETGYNGSTKLLIGSYGKNTNIRPPSDVDVIFKIPWTTYSKFSNQKTGPRGLLREIQVVLQKTFSTTEIIKPNGMVVEVQFATFNIEVLPGFEWSSGIIDGTFTVPDTSKGYTSLPLLYDSYLQGANYGGWKNIDPRREMKELSESNIAHNNNTINLTRMMKKWADNCSVPIKSVVLERLTIEFLRHYHYASHSFSFYDWMVRDFLAFLLRQKNTTIYMPGINENIFIGDIWLSKATTAYDRSVAACEYESSQNEKLAIEKWQAIFGFTYPSN